MCVCCVHAGEPVKVVLMGGSISLRGWLHVDQSYIRLLHKWLELTFVPGCRYGPGERQWGGPGEGGGGGGLGLTVSVITTLFSCLL